MTLVCDSGVTLSLLGVTGLTIVFKSKKGQGFLSTFRLRDVKSKRNDHKTSRMKKNYDRVPLKERGKTTRS